MRRSDDIQKRQPADPAVVMQPAADIEDVEIHVHHQIPDAVAAAGL